MIVVELTEPGQAEVAAQLAESTRDPELKTGLMMTQAALSANPKEQAEIYWQVYKLGRLAEQKFYWACIAWNMAKQPQRVIEAAEQWLRSGKRLERYAELQELQMAYLAAGREPDARRAATSDPEPPESPNPPRRRDRRSRGLGMGMF